ncbi:hypothetical protein P2H44_24670 [Albimonas sp. CAU 1670]|uniref:hypothetical protein n=1 Tax=Albimonas sp. CAU 1670 TaxID=3032599 RepID=UPI0023DBA3D5|nr:hypothetical protein [Albimonas sp. CAU 1670]MDF2235760.1 hypothetical protein [Albimonas sp. CAU 1670]
MAALECTTLAQSPKSFIKQTPWPKIVALMEACAVDASGIAAIDPDAKPEERARQALVALADAGQGARDEFLAIIDQVEQLNDDFGRRALRSVALSACMDAETFDAIESLRAAAIDVYLSDRRCFDRALASHYADRYRQGRSYSGYAFGGAADVELRPGEEAKVRFEEETRRIFSEHDAFARIHFDWFEREIIDPASGESHVCMQAAVFVEQPPRAETAFDDDGEIVTRSHRAVVEGAIVFDAAARQIEVVAKGGRPLQEKIARAFSETMLASDAPIEPVRARRLELQRLASGRPLALKPEDGVQSAEVERVTLINPTSSMSVTLAMRAGPTDDGSLRDRSSDAFEAHSPMGRIGWRVVAASIRVIFEPEQPGRRPKAVLVSLSAPNRSNLRDHTQRHQFIAGTLMERWGLYDPSDA